MALGRTLSAYFNRAMFRHHYSEYKNAEGEVKEIQKGDSPFRWNGFQEHVDHALKAYNYGLRYMSASANRALASAEDKANFKDVANWVKGVKKSMHLRSGELKQTGLASKVSAVVCIGSFVLSLLFLSPNLTGNVISNITNSTSNILGAGLLVVGLIAGYFWVKNKR